jgi:hypothetical protein
MASRLRASLLLVAVSCGSPSTHARELPTLDDPSAPHVSRTAGRLDYSGEMTAEGIAQLMAADAPSVHILGIRSQGGDVEVGMKLGEWVRERGLDVEVVDYCVSSCANYVFTAGRTRILAPGAVVAWHGDAHQLDFPSQIAKLGLPAAEEHRRLDHLREVRAREDAFFAAIGVDECLCRIGNESLGASNLFTMSAEDMERFGLGNVEGAPSGLSEIPIAQQERFGLAFVRVPDEWACQPE